MYHRGFRGSRRKSISRLLIKTFKKVLKYAPASFGAGFNNQVLTTGLDGYAVAQTTATDGNVPVGARLEYFEVQFCVSNVVSAPCYINCTLQYILSGQTAINPDIVGGDPQRNQVLHMDLFTVGADQNSTHKFKFKIPQKYQRVREGMQWIMTWSNNVSVNQSSQIIYKVKE